MLAPGRVLRGAAQPPADGLLRAGADRPRRPRARRRGPARLRQRLALGLHAGADRRRTDRFAVRLGLRMVKGLANADAAAIVAGRADSPSPRSRISGGARACPWPPWSQLAEADAFRAVARPRPPRGALGDQGACATNPAAVRRRRRAREAATVPEITSSRPSRCGPMTAGQRGGRGLRPYRPDAAPPSGLLPARPICAAAASSPAPRPWPRATGAGCEVAGLVLVRQRPGSAKGVMFITLEDETGIANLVVWPKVFERTAASCSAPA